MLIFVLTSVQILINTMFDNKCILNLCFLKVNYTVDTVIYLLHFFCNTVCNLKEVTNKISHIGFEAFTTTVSN